MASHRGIEAASQAVVDLLRDNYDPAEFNQDLEFRVALLGQLDDGARSQVQNLRQRELTLYDLNDQRDLELENGGEI